MFNVGAKRFRCDEVLFQPKTHELPDGEIITVGAKTLPFHGSIVSAGDPRTPRLSNASVTWKCCSGQAFSQRNPRLHPQELVRPMSCRQRHGQEVFERMTKELTASAPSVMKIKVVAPTDNIILSRRQNASAARSVVPTEVQRASGR